jgi:hypothetical protein
VNSIFENFSGTFSILGVVPDLNLAVKGKFCNEPIESTFF